MSFPTLVKKSTHPYMVVLPSLLRNGLLPSNLEKLTFVIFAPWDLQSQIIQRCPPTVRVYCVISVVLWNRIRRRRRAQNGREWEWGRELPKWSLKRRMIELASCRIFVLRYYHIQALNVDAGYCKAYSWRRGSRRYRFCQYGQGPPTFLSRTDHRFAKLYLETGLSTTTRCPFFSSPTSLNFVSMTARVFSFLILCLRRRSHNR